MISRNQFEALVNLLNAFKKAQGPADVFLKLYFNERPELGSHDRAFLSETFYAGLRRSRHLEVWVPDQDARHWALLTLTRVRGLSLRELGEACAENEIAWVNQQRQNAVAIEWTLGQAAELPDWVVEKLRAILSDEEILQLGRSLQEPGPLDLRVNTLKAKRADVERLLTEAGVESKPTLYAPLGIRVVGKPALQGLPLYRNGLVEVQDEGSQLLGVLMSPKRGDMVVDFCAGAGGKTLLLGAAMQNEGRLYAFDVSEKRLAQLKPRLKRSGLSNVHPVLIDSERDTRVKRLKGKIDRVLVDAPCSGLGTLRRNPDLKLRQSAEGVRELVEKQARILEAAAELVKPGGLLVYATCSLLPEENEAQAEAFRQSHPEFEPVDCGRLLSDARVDLSMGQYLRLWPHKNGTDGFFAAVWTRKG